jgi:parallel beta-helix repeat protein
MLSPAAIRRHLYALLVWGLLAAASSGADYYVATTGADAASGSSSSPWLTLQHAANLAHAGDTVHVAAGAYAGFEQTTSGAAGSPITYLASSGTSITSANTAGNGTDGIDIESANYITITGFTVNSMPRAGITTRFGTNNIITNNSCDDNVVWGIYTSHANNVLVQGNSCSNCQQQHGIYLANACTGAVLRGNRCFGNTGLGIHCNGDISNGAPGVISTALIDGNYLYNNVTNAVDGDGVINSTYENNVIYGNGGNGISLFMIDGAQGPSGDVLVNNTIVVPSNGRWGIALQNMGSGNQIYNNILLNANTSHGSINADSPSGFVSDYNIVVNIFSTDYNDNITLSQWRTQTSQDQHSIQATAASLFVNAAANNYALISGAPAIDAGTSTDAPSHDAIGTARPQGAGIDIGAYEFSSSAGTTSSGTSSTGTSTATGTGTGTSTSTGTGSGTTTTGTGGSGSTTTSTSTGGSSTTGTASGTGSGSASSSATTSGGAGGATAGVAPGGGGGGGGNCGIGGGLALLGALLLQRSRQSHQRQ